MTNLLKQHKQLFWILTITLIFRLLVGLLTDPYILFQFDSNTYSSAEYFVENIFLGQVNLQRTPIYPLFITFVRWICLAPDGYIPIVVGQEIVSLISLVFMYKIITRYTENNRLVFILSLAYSLHPTIWHWNKCILTESLSISFGVIFAWLLIRHLDKPKIWSAIALAVYSFLLVMLRPSFLSIFAIISTFWVVRFVLSKPDRRQSVTGFMASLVCASLLFSYMHLNYLQNGFEGLTVVSTANQIMNLMDADIYENPNYQDIVDSFTSHPLWLVNDEENKKPINYLAWIPLKDGITNFQLEYVRNYVSDTIKLHWREYMLYTGKKIVKSAGYQVSTLIPYSLHEFDFEDVNYSYEKLEAWGEEMNARWNIKLIGFLTFFIHPVVLLAFVYFSLNWAFSYAVAIMLLLIQFVYVYIYLGWAFSYTIIRWCKGKRDWIDLGVCLIIMSQLATIIISVPMEYSRLIQPSLPFLFVLVYKHIAEEKIRWIKMEWTKKLFGVNISDNKPSLSNIGSFNNGKTTL